MKLVSSTFTIISNGYADGPSQALRDYFIQHDAERVVTVMHPLVPEANNGHVVTRYEKGKSSESVINLPHRPPITYLFDSFVPFSLPRDTIWFGFNNLSCLRGMLRKKFGRTGKVVYWAVDFVPDRFGKGIATKVYNAVDRYVCNHVDMRVELSQEGSDGRDEYLGLSSKKMAPKMVIPMGAWLSRTPKTKSSAWKKKTIVYMGHLVERQGVEHAVRALALLRKDDLAISLSVVGSGPDIEKLKTIASDLGLGKSITFHGFVKDHKDVERILSEATIAVAPYAKFEDSFTQTADPGKVKAYLGASLPIVLTDVPPIAKEIERCGAALLVDDNPESVAEGLRTYLTDEKAWKKAREASAEKAKEFDWETLLSNGLRDIDAAK